MKARTRHASLVSDSVGQSIRRSAASWRLLLNQPFPGGIILLSNPSHYGFPHRLPRQRRRKLIQSAASDVKQNIQLLTVDHSARGSMKTAASCVSVCESQEYQIHRQVERTLRRRHSHVLPSVLHEGRIYITCIGFVPHRPAAPGPIARWGDRVPCRARHRPHWGVSLAATASVPLRP